MLEEGSGGDHSPLELRLSSDIFQQIKSSSVRTTRRILCLGSRRHSIEARLSVRSFDGGCSVEAHVPYKTAVSSPEPAATDLPLARPVKASWRIYYYLWSGCTPLNSKAGSLVFSCRFYCVFFFFFFGKFTIGHGLQ